jgi:predicted transcriptional regulator
VTLPVDLRRRLAATAQREGITHSQLALEAVDAHPRPTRDDPWATPPTDRLAPPRRSPRDTDGMVPTTLYLDDARLAALDRLAQHAGMSRSELVRSALQAHLQP